MGTTPSSRRRLTETGAYGCKPRSRGDEGTTPEPAGEPAAAAPVTGLLSPRAVREGNKGGTT